MRKNFESDSTLTLQEHFRILGIDTDGSYEEAQKAYRGLVRVYGESGAEPNENKLKQLNVSWDALKKHFDETRNSPEAILNDPISELEKQAKAAGVWDEVGSTIEKVQSGRLDARLIDRLASNDDPELSSDQITLDYLKEKIEMAIAIKELEQAAKAAGVWDEVGSTIEKVQSGRLDARLIDRLASNDDPELSSDQITLDYLKEKIEMAIKRKNG